MVIKNVKACSFLRMATLWLVLFVAGCGDGILPAPLPTMAQSSDIVESEGQQGATPFIRFVNFKGTSLAKLRSARFVISPKPEAASRPVDVLYTIEALSRRGYANPGSHEITLPVFGLYAGYQNRLALELQFSDESKQTLEFTITTPAYTVPNAIYDRPTILKKRLAG